MDFCDVSSLRQLVADAVYQRSEALVRELLALLEAGYVIKIGLSTGKDSSVVMNAAIEAMDRAISTGLIEASRPLVVVTVDTLLEPYNLQTYVPYAHAHIEQRCKELGINLHLRLCTPPLHQQLMVLFAGAQKLFVSSASGRNADCSILWKLDSARRAVSAIRKSLPVRYQNCPWINLSGSRSQESVRRKTNMLLRSEIGLKAQTLIDRIEGDPKANSSTYSFAPIEDWDTREVLDYLGHAGTHPVRASSHYIPAYHRNFGLLLAIYGEGSKDVCEPGASASGCGGVARYGCVTCGMVKEDRSGKEMLEYPRWERFGTEILAFRDYFVRVSLDVKARAYHPRAVCGVTTNVFLQPNTLRANVLERLLYLASQITCKHREIHKEFVARYYAGEIEGDIGVQDIRNDPSLSDDVKEQYVEAYVSRMLAKPMLEPFSEKHAVLLSALWSLHGVKSAPYRPIKILDSVLNGHSKPFPPTNQALNALRQQQGLPEWDDPRVLDKTVPEAMVFELFEPAKPFDHSVWDKSGLTDWMPIDFNQYIQNRAPAQQWADWTTPWAQLGRNAFQPLHSCRLNISFTRATDGSDDVLVVKQARSGRVFPVPAESEAYSELLVMANGKLDGVLERQADVRGCSIEELVDEQRANNLPLSIEFKTQLNWCRDFVSEHTATISNAKQKPGLGVRFSFRKRTKNADGQWRAGRASLRDYTPPTESGLYQQHTRPISYWLPDLNMARVQLFALSDYSLSEEQVHDLVDSIGFDDDRLEEFLDNGWHSAVREHDAHVLECKERNVQARSYRGTHAFHTLMNTSGLLMSADFESYVQRCLARTELFHSANLFNISSLSGDRLATLPNIIDINAHRSQKANQLLAIRRARNISRRDIKDTLESDHLNTKLAGRMNEFFAHYERAAKAHAFHKSYDGLHPKPRSITWVTALWLTEFTPIVMDFDLLVRRLTLSEERQVFLKNEPLIRAAFDHYWRLVKQLEERLKNDLRDKYQELATTISNIRNEDFVEDGMGNFELRDDSILENISRSYVDARSSRTVYLTQMGLIKRLAALHGLGDADRKTAETQLQSALRALNITNALPKGLDFSALDYDRQLRSAFTFEARVSSVMLSEERTLMLAQLRSSTVQDCQNEQAAGCNEPVQQKGNLSFDARVSTVTLSDTRASVLAQLRAAPMPEYQSARASVDS